MENFEEKKVKSYADYYATLLAMVRPAGKLNFILSSLEIGNQVEILDRELGIVSNNISVKKSNTRESFCRYFRRKIIAKTEEGRSKLYEFKFNAEDFVNLPAKLIAEYPHTATLIKTSSDADKSTSVVKPAAKKEKPLVGKTLPRRDFMERFLNLILLAAKNKERPGRVSKKDILREMKLKSLLSISTEIDKWRNTLKRGGIFLRATKIVGIDKKPYVDFENIEALVLDTESKMKKWGMLDSTKDSIVCEAIHIDRDEALKTTSAKKEIRADKSNYDTYHKIFIIGGVIADYGFGRVREFTDLTSILQKEFNESLSKHEIIDLIKNHAEKLFNISSGGCGIQGLSITKENWEEVKETFGPQNFKQSFYCRIGMTVNELKEAFPKLNIESVSKISETDHVFKIEFDKSLISINEAVRLRRTFRGSDIIFDEEIENLMQDVIRKQDGKFTSGLKYRIERSK